MTSTSKVYIVEHLDPEISQLGPWSSLEYIAIAKECAAVGSLFSLSLVPQNLELPDELKQLSGFTAESQSVEELYADKKDRVCLLDPSANKELSPEDGDLFDIFLFGGILGWAALLAGLLNRLIFL